MTSYLSKRSLQAVVVVLGVTVLTFGLEQLIPGDVARSVLGSRATPQAVAAFNHANGLDRSVAAQYWLFLDHLIHGNLGFSWKKNRSVDSIIAAELPRDIVLVGLATVIALAVAIPVGVIQAVKRNTIVDYAGTGISFVLYSMPPYVPGLLAVALFAVRLQLLPTEAPQGASALSLLAHPSGLALPVLTLALVTYAQFSRYMRSSVIDSLAQDYVRTARAKGLPGRIIMIRHLLRNSLIPVTTLVGLSVPQILTAGLIAEYLFNFQGVGLEYFNAATQDDFPVMVGITVLVGLATVIGSLLADLGYAALDPRVRSSR
jgi:peptide/nickel transport system permease protein